jgi:hypothetical protein
MVDNVQKCIECITIINALEEQKKLTCRHGVGIIWVTKMSNVSPPIVQKLYNFGGNEWQPINEDSES